MATSPHTRPSKSSNKKRPLQLLKLFREKYCTKQFIYSLVFDPSRIIPVACCLLLAEIFVNIFIIQHVKYTEIDWFAYMQEVEGVLNGTYDYTYLKGLAQYIFAAFYIILLILVFRIYAKSKKVPAYVLVLTCTTSYRIHSIFVLRLFNDPVAMMLFYAAVNFFIDSKWNLGSLFYSLAVSVKMNILLFSPALLLAYLICLGLKGTIKQLTICAFVQLILGLPFLLTNPIAYINGAFNLGRVFLYEWTVNWKFVPEDIFTNSYFHVGLLSLHIFLLLFFYPSAKMYFQSYATFTDIAEKVKHQLTGRQEKIDMSMSSQLLLLPLFTANLIGIACSRSLHYQFYVWYFHSLPYLLWSTRFEVTARLCILGVIEICWNTFPATWISSVTLHLCHIAILLGLALNKPALKVQ
ncbi:hypothetical protein L9F63_022631 [Diploptera punctata]|uniref:dolichyl-P-Man:Man5GlcNAc2-PP-dolichol alpha-1,3-mannosyltransferase n=1 Tax=Diploptera punctata TaxID=6984 RepID=A0AAD8EA76_DIPPU|nr:hypothetical protein L9F63_022631 [Diploptera punctata]